MAPSVTTLDLTSALRPERAALLALLRNLSADDWERSTECPAWSTKEIALHILGDDLSLLSRQRDASTNGLMLFAVDHPGASFRALLDGFNEQWVTASRFFSTELVIELLGLVGDWSATFYGDVGLATVSPEPVGLFAVTEPSPYWQVIAREYLERFTHQSQIRRAVGAEQLEGELVTSVASVVVHVLSAWMREYAPATGSTVAVDFGGHGTWTWERGADGWSVLDGNGAHTPDARITVAPAATVPLFSRGVSQGDVGGLLTVDGDDALARGAIEIIAPLVGAPVA